MASSDPFSAFGDAIGSIIGGENASNAIGAGITNVDALLGAGAGSVAPYNVQGTGQIPAIQSNLNSSSVVGAGRLTNSNPLDFENFASNYNMSEGAKYLMNTGETAQNNNAAGAGGFYSGANARANTQIAEGIANTDLLQQYQAMLSGQQQNTTQEQSAFTNMFNQEQLGEKAGATQSVLAGAGAGTIGQLFNQNANAQASKGSGIGGLVGTGLSFLAK